MKELTLRAHYDGTQILLDEPFELKPNTQLLVMVLESNNQDTEEWLTLSRQGLNEAYSDDEPAYSLNLIKEYNQEYDRR